ncbi:MAG: hypothetical protein HFE46_03915 [Clostridia bacterium]|nr:hypothetical protein [Clostridia bacterium]
MKKRITVILTVMLMLFVSVACIGCTVERASDYTEEEHLARVTERIEKKYMTENSKFTSFAVYPLYNEKDKLQYFLVEFEPYGFVYVKIRDISSNKLPGINGSLYGLSSVDIEDPWSRYTIDPTNSQPGPDMDKCYERDENGEIIEYNKSPFAIAGTEEEKKYLLRIRDEKNKWAYIPAIETEEGYLNLISMRAVECRNGRLSKKQATQFFGFLLKNYCNL